MSCVIHRHPYFANHYSISAVDILHFDAATQTFSWIDQRPDHACGPSLSSSLSFLNSATKLVLLEAKAHRWIVELICQTKLHTSKSASDPCVDTFITTCVLIADYNSSNAVLTFWEAAILHADTIAVFALCSF